MLCCGMRVRPKKFRRTPRVYDRHLSTYPDGAYLPGRARRATSPTAADLFARLATAAAVLANGGDVLMFIDGASNVGQSIAVMLPEHIFLGNAAITHGD